MGGTAPKMTLATESNVRVIRSVAEALISVEDEEGRHLLASRQTPHRERSESLFKLNSVDDGFCRHVLRTMENNLSEAAVTKLAFLLWTLSTPLGALLCAWPWTGLLPRSFPAMGVLQRRRALEIWSRSLIPDLRAAFKALKATILSSFYARVDHAEAEGNPTWPLIGYPGPPGSNKGKQPCNEYSKAESLLNDSTISLSLPSSQSSDAGTLREELTRRGLGVHDPGESEGQLQIACSLVVHCDAVVIGSGAGGGAAAAVLAEAGLKVVVVEKSSWQRASELSQQEAQAFETMYERSGFLSTEDGAVGILAGSTFGGGTTINWGACWRTPDHVRQEWAVQHGCGTFVSEDYDEALDAVCKRLGVRDSGFDYGPMDQLFLRGMSSLGCQSGPMPRNCLAPPGVCSSFCALGCATGHKRDTQTTWLADACENGAVCLTEAYAERVVTEPSSSMTKDGVSRSQRAVGVLVQHRTWPHGRVDAPGVSLLLRAPKIYVAAGAIHTSALLLRSGITERGNVGAHLRLHPAHVVWGQLERGAEGLGHGEHAPVATGRGSDGLSPKCATVADIEDLCVPPRKATHTESGAADGQGASSVPAPVTMWRGAMFTAFSVELAKWGDQVDPHGPMMACPVAHPGIVAAFLPWSSPAQHKRAMSLLDRTSLILVYHRDRGEGRVGIDAAGRPRVWYWPCQEDCVSVARGVGLGIKALAAAGATEIGTLSQSHGTCLVPDGADGPGVVAEYVREVERQGVQWLRTPVVSAHQMGTARMGSDPGSSACDPEGQTWSTAGLYVCDASAFPSASGANPMVTVEAIGRMVARLSLRKATEGEKKRRE